MLRHMMCVWATPCYGEAALTWRSGWETKYYLMSRYPTYSHERSEDLDVDGSKRAWYTPSSGAAFFMIGMTDWGLAARLPDGR